MHEFTHISNMMKDDKETFNIFVKEMLNKAEPFKEFVKLFGDVSECISIRFYELDVDDYGYPVAKWGVDFSCSLENKIIFCGYFTETMYKLIQNETNNIEFEGNYFEIIKYVNESKFNYLTQEELDKIYRTEEYIFDKCREWVDNINGFELIFEHCVCE